MSPTIRALIRYLSYPLLFGGAAILMLLAVNNGWPYWPVAPVVSAVAIAAVAMLERIQPYQVEWLADHGDTRVDLMHALTSLSLIFLTIEVVDVVLMWLPVTTLWPASWPLWLQVLLAGLVIDFGLWFMHKASHDNLWLWRLHALHHSSERLYWLNGERRHPFSALVLALPGITAAVLLGAPPIAIGTWMALVAVHLAFQHTNLDYSIGPLRRLIAVAETHRWHHKREFEDAQVNFGEFWMVWDHMAGTFRSAPNGVVAGEVGMRERMPRNYLGQLRWPFQAKN